MIRRARAFLLPLLLLHVACGPPGLPDPLPAAGKPGPRRGGVLRYAYQDDIRTLDPAIAYDEFSSCASHYLFDTLISYASPLAAEPLELVPQLAESWSVSEDGLTYAFTLRPGITYQDGTPIVAQHFVDALDRVLTPETGSPGAQFFAPVEGANDVMDGKAAHASGLRALDDRHLEIHLVRRDPSFAMVLAMKFAAPVPAAYAQARGDRIRDEPLASGPFKLKSWKQGSLIVFERNPSYWNRELPYLDGVEIELQVERNVAALSFLRGEIDSVERLSSDMYVQFARSARWQPYIHRTAGMNVYGELFDVSRPPFDDKRVRQAFNYAIDKRQSIIVMNGRGVVAHGIYPPGLPGYDASIPPYPYDPDKARALLAEAGYPDGFDIVYTTTKDELAEKIAQSIQGDLAKVGVRVRIQLVTFPAYLNAVGRHELQFGYTAWVMDFPDPWNFIEVKFHSRYANPPNASNDTGFSTPELDALLDAAHAESDPATRLAMYHQAEMILYEECPWVWHYHNIITEVLQPYVKDYAYHPVWMRSSRELWLDR